MERLAFYRTRKQTTSGCEIDDHGWAETWITLCAIWHGMRLGMAIRVSGRGRHLAWEENGEIRGLMNRSHNQIAVAVQWV